MINVSIKGNKISGTGFLKPKSNLHGDFWSEKTFDPEISEVLKQIVEDVIGSMDIKAEVKDIVITGSIASYNWHKLSDIDLHILLDFEEINEDFELVKRMLDQSRINWNKAHDIMIKDHEVELYFQDANEDHKSNGVWSLVSEAWLVEPEIESPELDLKTTEKKAEMLVKSIDHIENLIDDNKMPEAYQCASKLKNKISKLRSTGLSRVGIYSPENMAFKMLRNSKYLEKLSNFKIKAYDAMMSLNEIYIKDYFNSNTDPEYLEFEGKYNLEDLMDPNSDAPWGEVEKEDV